MEMWDIDMRVNTYLEKREYDQAERLLLEQYSQVKAAGDQTAVRHIINGIASFYCLPFKENLPQAELFYRELEAAFPGSETDLRLAVFYFYTLQDFTKTLNRVQAMGSLENQNKKDIQFYYSALTLKGQALLYLDRTQEAAQVLRELEGVIASSPKQIPYGDEFNFLNEMTQRKLKREQCKELATVIVTRIRDQECKEKFVALLQQLNDESPPEAR